MNELKCRTCNRKLKIENYDIATRTKSGYKLDCRECCNIKFTTSSSCNSYKKKRNIVPHNRRDYTNQKFGKLTAIKFDGVIGLPRKLRSIWLFKCDCGNEVRKVIYDVTCGRTTSCGCILKSHHGKYSSHWRGYEDIPGTFFSCTKSGAKSRNLEFSITMEYMWNLFLHQNKRCALSGEFLEFSPDPEKRTASLDRIDSSKGYIEGNVQWVHKRVNLIKWDLNQSEFLLWCKKITQFKNDEMSTQSL